MLTSPIVAIKVRLKGVANKWSKHDLSGTALRQRLTAAKTNGGGWWVRRKVEFVLFLGVEGQGRGK